MEPKDISSSACSSCSETYEEGGDFHTKERRKKPIKIASFYGGGTRGIISARFCQQIETITKLPMVELFDLFAGTSTGAIIAMALNLPTQAGGTVAACSAEKIVEIFKNQSQTIFAPYWYSSLWTLVRPKYDRSGLSKVLGEYCKDLHLADCIKDIMIPAGEIHSGEPWWFTNRGILSSFEHPEIDVNEAKNLSALDVLEATTAAPTYFDAKVIKIANKDYSFIDGGVFANNPSRRAVSYVEARYGRSAPEIISCFGTGECHALAGSDTKYNAGELFWARAFASVTLSMTGDDVTNDLKMCFPGTGEKQNLFVMQPTLEIQDYTLDDSSPEHMERLLKIAETYLEEEKHEEDMRLLCSKLETEYYAEEQVQRVEFY